MNRRCPVSSPYWFPCHQWWSLGITWLFPWWWFCGSGDGSVVNQLSFNSLQLHIRSDKIILVFFCMSGITIGQWVVFRMVYGLLRRNGTEEVGLLYLTLRSESDKGERWQWHTNLESYPGDLQTWLGSPGSKPNVLLTKPAFPPVCGVLGLGIHVTSGIGFDKHFYPTRSRRYTPRAPESYIGLRMRTNSAISCSREALIIRYTFFVMTRVDILRDDPCRKTLGANLK